MNALEVLGSFEKAVELTKEANTGCTLTSEVRSIALSPKYLGRLRTGVSEILDVELGRFSASLRGVLVAYGNIKLLQSSGVIMDDSPFIHFDVNLQAVVFNPKIGSLLKCVVNEQASDHVGCLVHDWFNLSLLATRKELNGQRQLRLEPGYVLLVQVERLHSLHGMLAIEARAPDDGSDLILEAVGQDTDTESNVDSVLQPSLSDNPDGPGSSAVTLGSEKKKKKRTKVKQEAEPSSTPQTVIETTSPKKSKKHKHKEISLDSRDSPTAKDSAVTGNETTRDKKKKKKQRDSDGEFTQLATGEEASNTKKKKRIKTEADPSSEPEPCDLDGEFTQITPGGETSHKKKKKKKKKHRESIAGVDSNQPPVSLNGPATVKVEKEDGIPHGNTKKRRTASEDVVSSQSPSSSPDKKFTKLKKNKHRDKDSERPIDSTHQPPFSDIYSSTPEETSHKKAKKHKHRIKQESAIGDKEYATSDTNIEAARNPEGHFVVKNEPGIDDSRRSHKKQKRKAVDYCDLGDASVTNGSIKKEKRKKREV